MERQGLFYTGTALPVNSTLQLFKLKAEIQSFNFQSYKRQFMIPHFVLHIILAHTSMRTLFRKKGPGTLDSYRRCLTGNLALLNILHMTIRQHDSARWPLLEDL